MKVGIAFAVLGLVGFGLVATGMVQLPGFESLAVFTQPAPPLVLPRVDLKSLRSEYGFLQGSFVITNANAFPVANAAIRCEVQGPDGAVVHTFDFVIDEPVAANGQKAVSDYKFGFWSQQASQMKCQTVSAERR